MAPETAFQDWAVTQYHIQCFLIRVMLRLLHHAFESRVSSISEGPFLDVPD